MRNNSDEKQSYAEKLKDPRWQKKRLQILNRDKWKCKLCGDEKTSLQVHHKEYINGNDPWDYDNSMLITVCEHCHYEIEYLNKRGIDFNQILSIYKADGWNSGSRIMFISQSSGICSMVIYDDEDKKIIGYNLRYDIPEIIKILKKTLNGKEIH